MRNAGKGFHICAFCIVLSGKAEDVLPYYRSKFIHVNHFLNKFIVDMEENLYLITIQ